MRPSNRPRSSSGTQITELTFKCMTLFAELNSSSCIASEMITGRRDRTTFAMIESESCEMASSMFSRLTLRATLMSSESPSARIKKPLSAFVIWMTASMSVSSSSVRSRTCMSCSLNS